MTLSIQHYGADALRQIAEPVRKVNADTKALIKEMFELMYADRGVGLAAPQVGVSKRVIVFDTGHRSPQAIVNPALSKGYGMVEGMEGCLSLPGVVARVMRFDRITVSGQDEKGRAIKLDLTGLAARIVQHEVDHLNGVLITDVALNQDDVARQVEALRQKLANDAATLYNPS